MCANADRRQRHIVVARKNLEAAGQRVNQLGDLGRLAAGLLDGLNVGRGSSQPDYCLWVEVYRRASGHVVERHRERVHSPRQSQKVLKLALLRRFVVVGIGR